jgi:hypothetical protein
MIRRPPPNDPRDESDDDWGDDWQDPDERRFLGMTARTALWVIMSVGVGLAIIAIIVIALVNSGKSNNQAAPGTTGGPTSTLSPAAVPPSQVTCAVITADPNLAGVYTFVPAPTDLPNTPLPALPPARQCTGTADRGKAPNIVALIWPDLTTDTYRQQLLGADWLYDDQRGQVQFFKNPSSPYEIAILTVDNALVALYDQG